MNLLSKIQTRVHSEIGARNYDYFKNYLLKNDRRYQKRDPKKFKTFYDINGNEVDVEKILKDLLENGFAVVENLYTETWVDNAYKQVMAHAEAFKKGKVKKSSLWSKDFGYEENLLSTGIVRFYNVDNKIPQAKDFARNELLKYIGELYYQKKLTLQTVISQYNEVSKVPCRGYHIDSHVDQFKTFIYLCDVDKTNGPHTYLKGSHKNTEKVMKKLHESLAAQISGEYKTKDSTGLSDKDAKKLGFKEELITGKKGTVLLVDTRGIHQGGTLKKGHRVVFNTYYYLD
jgi:hypothetical protein